MKREYPTFDCHNRTYAEIEDEFENWLLLNESNTPLEIITGKSETMRKLIMTMLDHHRMSYQTPMANYGKIVVL